MKRVAGALPGRSRLSTADVKSPSKHMKKGMRSRSCWRLLGRDEYSNEGGEKYTKKNRCCLNTHKADSAVWTTLRYRHSSLYLQTSQSKGLVLEAAGRAKRGVVKLFLWNLFCRCSSSLLRKMTVNSSVSTSFFFPSLRTPETFWPFSTVTSRMSSQGRTHRLKHTRQNDTEGLTASVGCLGDGKGKAVAVTRTDRHTPVPQVLQLNWEKQASVKLL